MSEIVSRGKVLPISLSSIYSEDDWKRDEYERYFRNNYRRVKRDKMLEYVKMLATEEIKTFLEMAFSVDERTGERKYNHLEARSYFYHRYFPEVFARKAAKSSDEWYNELLSQC